MGSGSVSIAAPEFDRIFPRLGKAQVLDGRADVTMPMGRPTVYFSLS